MRKRISDVQDNYGTRYGAHYTGEIVVKAYAEENANVYTTFTIDVECEPLEGVDNSNRCHYIAISHNDIGGSARPALFRDAMSLFSLSEGNSNGTAGGGSAQLQVCKTIRDAKVAAIHSHGKPNAISIVKNQHDEAYCLTANFIMNLHDGFFASTNLLISLACQSNAFVSPFASTGNVLSAFRNKGVKCTIGFDSPVATENARNFEESFYQYISENAADYPIIRDMFNNFGSDNSTYGAKFTGENYTTFNS